MNRLRISLRDRVRGDTARGFVNTTAIIVARSSTPVGTLVVKVNGQWVAADFSSPGIPKRISGR